MKRAQLTYNQEDRFTIDQFAKISQQTILAGEVGEDMPVTITVKELSILLTSAMEKEYDAFTIEARQIIEMAKVMIYTGDIIKELDGIRN